jgi:thiamine biosynthesis lipoprotein
MSSTIAASRPSLAGPTGRPRRVLSEGGVATGALVATGRWWYDATALVGLAGTDGVATGAFATGLASRSWLEDLSGAEGYAVSRAGDRWWTSGFEAWGTTPTAQALGACAG